MKQKYATLALTLDEVGVNPISELELNVRARECFYHILDLTSKDKVVKGILLHADVLDVFSIEPL